MSLTGLNSELGAHELEETIVNGERGFVCKRCGGLVEARFGLSMNGTSRVWYKHMRDADRQRCEFLRGVVSGARL